MLQILKRNPQAVAIAVVMHIIILIFLVVGVDWLKKPEQPKVNVDVVQARVVDESKVAAEVEKLKQAEEQKKAARRKEEQRLADLKKKQEAEKKRLADLEKKRQEEQKRLAREKQQRLAEEKKRKEAEAKRKQEEQKRKEAEAKRKAEEEAKRKAEAEAKRKEDEARKAREAELQAAMEAERNAGEINRYMGLIQQKVKRYWLRPAGAGGNLQCRVRVRLAPGGTVIGVSILQSSGNGAFDRSAEAAVYKADPLPVPTGNLFEQFRDINFVFDPSKGE